MKMILLSETVKQLFQTMDRYVYGENGCEVVIETHENSEVTLTVQTKTGVHITIKTKYEVLP